MAGQLTIDTLKASSGVLATQNGMTGIAKAWVNFNGGTAAIAGSFNVSSITRTATGTYTVNFTTAMANANYAVSASAGNVLYIGGTLTALVFINNNAITPSTSAFGIVTVQSTNNTAYDPTLVCVTVQGS